MARIEAAVGDAQAAVERGCAFLRGRQLPTGELPTCASADWVDKGAWQYDGTVFATAVIGLCLQSVPGPDVAFVMKNAARFLRAQMKPPGVWRFWTPQNPRYGVIPFDSDDTACAAAVLARNGGVPREVAGLLLANRDRHGLFYTWFVRHPGRPPRHPGFWRAAVSGWRRPLGRAGFWHVVPAKPHDVDSAVNANVLMLLGETAQTRPVVEHLIQIVRERREHDCDNYYRRPLAVHHAIARCFARGVTGLGAVRELAVARILARRRDDGSFGDGALETALAACALGDWGYDGPEISAARASLLGSQLPSGGWPAAGYFVGGPKGDMRWGSEEITAGFAVQALAGVLNGASEGPSSAASVCSS